MIEIIAAALAYAVFQAIITVAVLLISAVVTWFVERANEMSENDIAFTLKQEMAQGYTVYQGIFNQSSGHLGKVRKIKASQLDSDLRRAHAQNNLVVYT